MNVLLFLLPFAQAGTVRVGPNEAFQTIQAGVDGAADGDVVVVTAGTWTEPVVIRQRTLSLINEGPVTLTSAGPTVLEIRGGDVQFSGFTFDGASASAIRVVNGANVRAVGITVHNCLVSSDGAGMHISNSTVRIVDSVFADNGSPHPAGTDHGAHIYLDGSDVEAYGSTFARGTASYGGGFAVVGDSALLVEGSTVTDHYATGDGGVVWSDCMSGIAFRNSTVEYFRARGDGGVAWEGGGGSCGVSFGSSIVRHGSADGSGGLVFGDSQWTAHGSVSESWVEDVEADNGGAIMVNHQGSGFIYGSVFVNVRARQQGGVLWTNESEATMVGSVFHGCSAQEGGVLWSLYELRNVHDTKSLIFNHFIENTAPVGSVFWGRDLWVEIVGNLFLNNHGGPVLDVGRHTNPQEIDYNAWYMNDGARTTLVPHGPHVYEGDPMLRSYTGNGVYDDDVHLLWGSPLIDVVPPPFLDPDGTFGDIGIYAFEYSPESFVDLDGDGTLAAYDCDDANPAVHVLASERCNGVDDDCNGAVDDPAVPPLWHVDQDGDGFGGAVGGGAGCAVTPGYQLNGDDCDDLRADAFPGAHETCDGADEDCDGVADDGPPDDAPTWYLDLDADGAGDPAVPIRECVQPADCAAAPTDCDDLISTTAPGLPERCNGVDDDCDGVVDPPLAIDATPWFADADGDGFGNPNLPTVVSCGAVAGRASQAGDCDDAAAGVHPGVAETCADTSDHDCDGTFPNDDVDGDGSPGCVDCDDDDATVYPGAPDAPYDGRRQDCDATTDNDADADGYDDEGHGGDDCDDADPAVHPGASESASDTVDRNCDGVAPGDDDDTGGGRRGCATAPGGSFSALLAALAMVGRRAGRRGAGLA